MSIQVNTQIKFVIIRRCKVESQFTVVAVCGNIIGMGIAAGVRHARNIIRVVWIKRKRTGVDNIRLVC